MITPLNTYCTPPKLTASPSLATNPAAFLLKRRGSSSSQPAARYSILITESSSCMRHAMRATTVMCLICWCVPTRTTLPLRAPRAVLRRRMPPVPVDDGAMPMPWHYLQIVGPVCAAYVQAAGRGYITSARTQLQLLGFVRCQVAAVHGHLALDCHFPWRPSKIS
jgi:hypothetical protein